MGRKPSETKKPPYYEVLCQVCKETRRLKTPTKSPSICTACHRKKFGRKHWILRHGEDSK